MVSTNAKELAEALKILSNEIKDSEETILGMSRTLAALIKRYESNTVEISDLEIASLGHFTFQSHYDTKKMSKIYKVVRNG